MNEREAVILEQQWEGMYDRLKLFKEREGHCNVPYSFIDKGMWLGRWFDRQRQHWKKGSLDKKHHERLQKIDASWAEETTGRSSCSSTCSSSIPAHEATLSNPEAFTSLERTSDFQGNGLNEAIVTDCHPDFVKSNGVSPKVVQSDETPTLSSNRKRKERSETSFVLQTDGDFCYYEVASDDDESAESEEKLDDDDSEFLDKTQHERLQNIIVAERSSCSCTRSSSIPAQEATLSKPEVFTSLERTSDFQRNGRNEAIVTDSNLDFVKSNRVIPEVIQRNETPTPSTNRKRKERSETSNVKQRDCSFYYFEEASDDDESTEREEKLDDDDSEFLEDTESESDDDDEDFFVSTRQLRARRAPPRKKRAASTRKARKYSYDEEKEDLDPMVPGKLKQSFQASSRTNYTATAIKAHHENGYDDGIDNEDDDDDEDDYVEREIASVAEDDDDNLDSGAPIKRRRRPNVRVVKELEEYWARMYEMLKEFKKKHGHIKVPRNRNSDNSDERLLYYWYHDQRKRWKNGKLAPRREKLLSELGYEWEPLKKSWLEKFRLVKHYVEQEGHGVIPRRCQTIDPKTGKLTEIGPWFQMQKRLRRKGELEKDRERMLTDLGVSWGGLEEVWHEMFEFLLQFKEREGHLNVPLRHKENGRPLGEWFRLQRGYWIAGSMKKDRFRLLKHLGVYWADEKRLERVYKESKQGCVQLEEQCSNYKVAPYLMSVFRHETKKENQERPSSEAVFATSIEFTRELNWQAMFDKLVDFKRVKGHCNVPARRQWKGCNLGSWVNDQRKFKRRGVIDPKRDELLTALGLQWFPNDDRWREKLLVAKRYKERCGHCRPPKKHREFNPRTKEYEPLGTWLQSQRHRRAHGKMPENQIRDLEELGMEWGDVERRWDHMFSLLKAYKKREGHVRVPRNWIENDARLGHWITTQKLVWGNGAMERDCLKQLKEIGISWAQAAVFDDKNSEISPGARTGVGDKSKKASSEDSNTTEYFEETTTEVLDAKVEDYTESVEDTKIETSSLDRRDETPDSDFSEIETFEV